jgi:hypothetical protein
VVAATVLDKTRDRRWSGVSIGRYEGDDLPNTEDFIRGLMSDRGFNTEPERF